MSLDSAPSPSPLPPVQRRKPRWFELRMAALFVAVFVPNGFHLPYFPFWLAQSGFTPGEISVLLAIPMFARVVAAPTVSALADRAPDRVPVLIALALLAAFAACGYFLPPTYVGVLLVSIVFGVFWGPHNPLADSLALSGVRRFGSDYPKMRVWGSISFLCANALGGFIIGRAGAGAFPWMLVAGLLLIAAVALVAPRLGRPRRPALQPAEALPQAAGIFRQRYFLLFISASALIQSTHAQLYTFGTIYWRSIGIGDTTIGFLWAFAVVAESIMFFFFRRLFGRVSSPVMVATGAVLAISRWAIFPFVAPLGLGVPGFFVLQGLHAFSFSAVFLGTQKMLSETIPEERIGAAQGVAYFGYNGLLAILTLVAGPLYARLGTYSFEVMALIGAFGLGLALGCIPLAPKGGLGRQYQRIVIDQAG